MAVAFQALLVLSCLAGATGFTTLHQMPLGIQRMPLCRASEAARSHFAPFTAVRHQRSLRYFPRHATPVAMGEFGISTESWSECSSC